MIADNGPRLRPRDSRQPTATTHTMAGNGPRFLASVALPSCCPLGRAAQTHRYLTPAVRLCPRLSQWTGGRSPGLLRSAPCSSIRTPPPDTGTPHTAARHAMARPPPDPGTVTFDHCIERRVTPSPAPPHHASSGAELRAAPVHTHVAAPCRSAHSAMPSQRPRAASAARQAIHRGVLVASLTPHPTWDRCVSVPSSMTYVSPGGGPHGAQRLAALAVVFSTRSDRSFPGVPNLCLCANERRLRKRLGRRWSGARIASPPTKPRFSLSALRPVAPGDGPCGPTARLLALSLVKDRADCVRGVFVVPFTPHTSRGSSSTRSRSHT